MTKNWTQDLPVDKGAFEGGNLEGKRADEHILLSVEVEKNDTFRDIAMCCPEGAGVFPSFPPRGQGGLRRWSIPM